MRPKLRKFLLYVLITSILFLNFLDVFHSKKHHNILPFNQTIAEAHLISDFENDIDSDNDCFVCLIQNSLFSFITLTFFNFAFLISHFFQIASNISIYKISFLLPSNRAPPLNFI